MPRCRRCGRRIRAGEYGPCCAKKRTRAEQKTLNFDPVIDPTASFKKQHEQACKIIFKKE